MSGSSCCSLFAAAVGVGGSGGSGGGDDGGVDGKSLSVSSSFPLLFISFPNKGSDNSPPREKSFSTFMIKEKKNYRYEVGCCCC